MSAKRSSGKVVVDPNVLVSAAISARGAQRAILGFWLAGRFKMVVFYNLLLELETVLLRDKFRKMLTVADVLSYVEYLREHATLYRRGKPSVLPVIP